MANGIELRFEEVQFFNVTFLQLLQVPWDVSIAESCNQQLDTPKVKRLALEMDKHRLSRALGEGCSQVL